MQAKIQKTKKHKTQKEQAPNKIYTWTIDFTDLIIWIKKLPNSDWLKAVQFFFFVNRERVHSMQKEVTIQAF